MREQFLKRRVYTLSKNTELYVNGLDKHYVHYIKLRHYGIHAILFVIKISFDYNDKGGEVILADCIQIISNVEAKPLLSSCLF